MQRIWNAAVEALGRAELIDVYGYGLPESDFAVRTLFNPLWFRLERCDGLQLRAHDSSCATRRSWTEFLGREDGTDGRRIEEEPI